MCIPVFFLKNQSDKVIDRKIYLHFYSTDSNRQQNLYQYDIDKKSVGHR